MERTQAERKLGMKKSVDKRLSGKACQWRIVWDTAYQGLKTRERNYSVHSKKMIVPLNV